MHVFDVLFYGLSTWFGPRTIEKYLENPPLIFCSSFPNLRLGSIKLVIKMLKVLNEWMALLVGWVFAVCIKHVQRRNGRIAVSLQVFSHRGNVSSFAHSLYQRCKSFHVNVDTCVRSCFLCFNVFGISVRAIRLAKSVWETTFPLHSHAGLGRPFI